MIPIEIADLDPSTVRSTSSLQLSAIHALVGVVGGQLASPWWWATHTVPPTKKSCAPTLRNTLVAAGLWGLVSNTDIY
jgi:hypothetical protein